MSKVFGKNNGRPNRVKRNGVDLSFRNNVTMNYGGCYPILCKPVLPGDSVDMDIAAALRFMPTVFPLQTRQRLDIHAFYVRNRNLWEDWPDFVGMLKDDLIMPYLSASKCAKVKTGSIYDYLGLATTVVGGSSSVSTAFSPSSLSRHWVRGQSYNSSQPTVASVGSGGIQVNDGSNIGILLDSNHVAFPEAIELSINSFTVTPPLVVTVPSGSVVYDIFNGISDVKLQFLLVLTDVDRPDRLGTVYGVTDEISMSADKSSSQIVLKTGSSGYPITYDPSLANQNPSNYTMSLMCSIYGVYHGSSVTTGMYPDPSWASWSNSTFGFRFSASPEPEAVGPVDFIDAGKVNPYLPQNGSKVNTLRLRAYESIYNSFYRDDRNNPFMINGQPEYNRYIVSTEGGEDDFDYQIRYRHWEQDEFTTALPSPQQGVAPLVGISDTGVATFEDPDTHQKYNVATVLADDGVTITNFKYTENIPGSVARSLVNYATSGISINDFRNVNAFQRWKETNIRRGFKYRDQIKSHYDVDVSFAELDMPEFLGGTSIDVSVETVTQTSATEGAGNDMSPLGSYAGQMYAVGRSKNRIRKYFDEHGYFMVIASLVPVPVYTQAVDKDWYKSETLDYFFPEFGHIGLQSVPLRELAPVQAVNIQGAEALTRTFGYQRPWYDYLSSKDEAHGLFRTELNNFMLNRVFDNVPSLSPSFLLVDPEQLNNVFATTDVSDKILGQFYFDMTFTRPIPMYGVPRLEANI